jgi:hypothetical protein
MRHFIDKGGSGQRPAGRDVIPFDSGRRGTADVPLMDSGEAKIGATWPGLWPKGFAGTGPIFLLGIGILLGIYSVLNYENSTTTNLKADGQLRSGPTSRQSSPALPLSNESPNHPAYTEKSEGSIPEHISNGRSTLHGVSTPHYLVRFEATRKKTFGGCTGELELTSAGLHFRCSNDADLNIPVGLIAKAHKDGVVLDSGEKYHFLIANHTKAQVELIFSLWLNRVRRLQRPS